MTLMKNKSFPKSAKAWDLISRPALAALAVLAVFGTTDAFAAGEGAEAPDPCDKANSQYELNQCYGREYEKADAKLNKVYQALLKKLEHPREKVLLREAEQAWLSYRDKECAFETSGSEGGSIHPMVLSICLMNKTTAHTAELDEQLHCPEGVVDCMR